MRYNHLICAKCLTLAVLLSVPFGAAKAVVLTVPQAGVCDSAQCNWDLFDPMPPPNPGGDVWINFESTAGAGDMAHFEAFSGDEWLVVLRFEGDYGVTSLLNPEEIFLSEMGGAPIDRSKYVLIATALPNGNTLLGVRIQFLDHLFVHDLHFECVIDSVGDPCDDTTNQGAFSLFIGADNPDTSLVTGVWPVPEPTTLALMGLGLAVLGFQKKKVS